MCASITISQKATILNNALWNFRVLVVYLLQAVVRRAFPQIDSRGRPYNRPGLRTLGYGCRP